MNETDNDREVLEVPVPAPVAIRQPEPKLVQVTKFFSWLTALILAISVLVSLYGVTIERNDLRTQVAAQSEEQACRSAANFTLFAAQSVKQIAVADNQILTNDFLILLIDQEFTDTPASPEQILALRQGLIDSKIVLAEARANLEAAVEGAKQAQVTCRRTETASEQ